VIGTHIAINGELGSGKTSVARRLADTYGMRIVSTGDVQRGIAESLRMTTLETNLLAERDAMIDARVDSITRDLGSSPEPIIFDSRMAWKMVPNAFKVRLIADMEVAAVRLYQERSTEVEGYASLDQARKAAEKRYQSERRRFLAKYSVDISHLKNYDLVIDTSDASIDDVAAEIESVYEPSQLPGMELRISPRRVLPGYDLSQVSGSSDKKTPEPTSTPSTGLNPVVAYARPFVYALDGLLVIIEAIKKGKSFMKATLLAEGTEIAAKGLSAEEYLRREIRAEWITAWEQAHGIQFSRYPDATPAGNLDSIDPAGNL
jgi:CMP/dCMP kinase